MSYRWEFGKRSDEKIIGFIVYARNGKPIAETYSERMAEDVVKGLKLLAAERKAKKEFRL